MMTLRWTRPYLVATAAVAGALLVGVAASCGDDGGSSEGGGGGGDLEDIDGFSRSQLLADVGECAVGNYERFLTAADILYKATEQYEASLSVDDRKAAQDAFVVAMTAWQRAELYQFGPAGRMGQVAGGKDLRDAIYSWNQDLIGGGTSPCRVDQELVSKSYEGDLGNLATSRRGLDALAYLLFVEGTENACTASNALNTDGSWAELSDDELTRRRAEYASAVAADVKQNAEALVTAWAADGGDFQAELRTAGAGSSVYPTQRDALDNIATLIVVLENGVKDMKLGEPLAVSGTCPGGLDGGMCPSELEARHGAWGKAAIRANIQGALQLFKGCGAVDVEGGGPVADARLGFQAYLAAAGDEATGDIIVGHLEAALAAVEAAPDGALAETLMSDPSQLQTAHTELVEASKLLKSTFLTVLDIQVPQNIPADND